MRATARRKVQRSAPGHHAMPRQSRLHIAGIPQHVVLRGNNRQPCFFRDQDYLTYLAQLHDAARTHDCQVHAYVLMTNHVHLLMTGGEESSIPKTMQTLGRYVGYLNASYRRTGTSWEGHYKACLVDSDAYVLTCYRYIELNPVRAAMVEESAAHRWSSYQTNALGIGDVLIAPHPTYMTLGPSDEERQACYRSLFLDAISDDRLQEIRAYLHQQRALGSPRFQQAVEAQLQQAATVRPRGRPSRRPTIG